MLLNTSFNDKVKMIENNTLQQEKDKIIDYQLCFQNLLISISTKYINADLTNVTALIEDSLEQIGRFVSADRSYVFSYDLENKECSNTFEWCKEGIGLAIVKKIIAFYNGKIWIESEENTGTTVFLQFLNTKKYH